MTPSWSFQPDPTENGALMDDVFSSQECRRIIAIGDARMPAPATVDPRGIADAAVRDNRIVFPSYVLHEVCPVTRGTRYSLVSWVTGAPFK